MKQSYFLSALLVAGATAFTANAKVEHCGPMEDFLVECFPKVNSVLNPMTEGVGLESLYFYLDTEGADIQVNTECKEPIVLMKANGEEVASIKANVDMMNMEEFEPYAVCSMEEGYNSISLMFSMDPITEPGKYVVVIPEAFFAETLGEDVNVLDETMFGYTLVNSNTVGSFESMVWDATPLPGSKVHLQDEEYILHGFGDVTFGIDSVNGFAINEECVDPVLVKVNGEVLFSIKATDSDTSNAFVMLSSPVAFADAKDDDFAGNDDDDQFSQDADGQDPSYGGNDPDSDQHGQDADGQDPSYGGNDPDSDQHGQDSDEQDPSYGGNDPDSDDQHGQDSEDQDPSFGGNEGDDNFGIDAELVTLPATVMVVFTDENEEGSKKEGTYTIEIPDNFFKVDASDEYTTAVYSVEGSTFTYYVVNAESAVNMFKTENSVTVYSINGTRILNNAAAESLGTLNSGLYIINGKKVIIK